MNAEQMKERTKRFALRIIRLTEALPNTRTADVIARQLLRSGTSVGANYREACEAQSRPEFISKMSIVHRETEESLYWMELLVEAKLVDETRMKPLMDEVTLYLSQRSRRYLSHSPLDLSLPFACRRSGIVQNPLVFDDGLFG